MLCQKLPKMLSPSSSPLPKVSLKNFEGDEKNQEGSRGLQQAKRKQVKNACVHCQKACKKCDDLRPCSRCIKYGLEDSCEDSRRKSRKRNGATSTVADSDTQNQPIIRMTSRQKAVALQRGAENEITEEGLEEEKHSKRTIRISLKKEDDYEHHQHYNHQHTQTPSPIFPPPIHTPLFNRVLNFSAQSISLPPIGDLASICSDILLMDPNFNPLTVPDPPSPPKTPLFYGGKTIYTPLDDEYYNKNHHYLHSPSPKSPPPQLPSFLEEH